jgi:4-hydroxybutyrate CoA-transferase
MNDPNIIAQNDNMVSVNNTLMVDLTGQVCSETIGFRQYSGTGGQLDFVRGAQLSKGGQSFIALPSTLESKEGLKSRIALALPPGEVITVPRSDVDQIVTEYGVAELKYKTLAQRVKAMISVAHPQFRDELYDGAKKAGLIY